MSLLEHPKAQALLAEAEVTARAVRGCKERLTRFLQRYLPLFYREEQRELAQVVIAGKLSNLQRKTSEPIAYAADRERKPVQHFVGAGKWDDEAVIGELRQHVAEELGDPDGVLVVDGSSFPTKLWQLLEVARRRHDIEQVLQEAKGEVGLGHYEVRSWVGWHHPMASPGIPSDLMPFFFQELNRADTPLGVHRP